MYSISVIVPFYNAEGYVNECIDRITNQTYKNLEIICVDDGSVDNTESLLRLKQNSDDRIVVIHKENGGVSSARNCGLKYAKGNFICFVDCDDVISADYCEQLLTTLLNANTDMSVCSYRVSEHLNGKIVDTEIVSLSGYKENEFEALYEGRLLNPLWNKMLRAVIAKRILFNTDMSAGEDLAYIIEYLKISKKMSFIDSPLYEYIHYADADKQKSYSSNELENYLKMLPYLMSFLDCEKVATVLYRQLMAAARHSYFSKRQVNVYEMLLKSEEVRKLSKIKQDNGRLEVYRRIILHKRKKILYFAFVIEESALKMKRRIWR